MPEAARIVTTDSEIDLAIKRARQYEKYDRRVVRATFSKSADKLRLILDDNSILLYTGEPLEFNDVSFS